MDIDQILPLIAWGLFLSLYMLASCEFARWRQRHLVVPQVQDRVYQVLVGFAVVIISRGVLDCWEYRMSPMAVRLDHLWSMVRLGLFPLFLWTLFHLPLSLTRRYTRVTTPIKDESHPLDGTWPAQASFLDRIAQADLRARTTTPSGPDRPPPLERVARLRPTSPDPESADQSSPSNNSRGSTADSQG